MLHFSQNAGQIIEIVRPFLVLHLDIRPSTVHTIEDSLQLYFGTEKIEGYKSSKIRMVLISLQNFAYELWYNNIRA